ncbi:tail protein X [Phascolarctobacterium succinatutens]|uniref:tail protein X n=1 Tax=Phascolarctobacterium succinatutens TaxID=626940 RepID=UPI0026F1011A|nr:tail protein X [Phascolarctobacterium succinatutens]
MRKTYTTTQGDMWDLIAKRLYNDEASLNVLLEANQRYADMVVFSAGVELVVPEYTALVTSMLPPWRR